MAAQSHFHHCRPLSTPLMSYSFTCSVVCHSQQRNQNARSNRVVGFPQVYPVRNRSRTTGFCTTTGLGAPPVCRLAGRSLTAFAGFGSVEQKSLQALAVIDVVSLLRAWWIAASLPILAASKITEFHDLLLSLAGRGKIMESSSNVFFVSSALIFLCSFSKLSVPQKFFFHFYIVGVICTTFLLVATWLYAYKTAPISVIEYKYGIWKSVFLLLLMEAQVLRRLFESIYVFKYSPSARMHIAAYLTGLSFYIAAPLSLCCTYSLEVFKFVGSSFAEFVVKGMQVIEFDLRGHVNPLLQLQWYVWIGAAVFSWGWIHQRRCHAILGSLRENNRKVDDYAIPRGDWFEYFSSPHYLAEIVIYGGVVIASGLSDITIWLLFGFVVANLTFAAAETRKWYLRKFDNYPKNRYAIIPFVY